MTHSPLLAELVARWSRREFVSRAGIALIACSIGACSSDGPADPSADPDDPDPTPPPNTPAPLPAGVTLEAGLLTIAVAAQPDLQTAGGLLTLNRPDLALQVLVVALGGNAFAALTAVCTHSGCANRWSSETDRVVCGCHGSTFAISGAVIAGPATDPLRAFTARYVAARGVVEVVLS